jgi:hypothetical protein
MGLTVFIPGFTYIVRHNLMLGHRALALLDTPCLQIFDNLEHLDIQVPFAPGIAGAATGAFKQCVHKLGPEFQLSIQFS